MEKLVFSWLCLNGEMKVHSGGDHRMVQIVLVLSE